MQCKAASLLEGPVLIIAGAGSGKTRMITYRIAHMLESGIRQSEILALTFTNKAAQEMSERIRDLTGKKLKSLTTTTFHAFGVKVIRRYAHLMGYEHNFSIYDQADKTSLLKTVIRDLKIPLEEIDLFELSNLFGAVKTGRDSFSGYPSSYKTIFDEYRLYMKAYNAVDFDDLITMTIELLDTHEEVLEHYRQQFRYIMVDEFQDTSLSQYRIIELLAKEHRNICVVGDDDQSIYSWRGANYENILRFETDFPEVVEIKLEQNYRSTGNILHAANTLIANNTKRKEKALWTGFDKGSSIAYFQPEDERKEGQFIGKKIRELMARESLRYDDFGVLVRTNALLGTLEQEFLTNDIPYTVSGGQSFFSRKEIKDVTAYLRLLSNPDDDVNFLRIINTPRRGIGRVSLERLREYARGQGFSLYSALVDVALGNGEFSSRIVGICQEFTELIEQFKTQIFKKKNLANSVRALIGQIDYRSHLIAEHPDNERLVSYKAKSIDLFISMIDRWEKDPDRLDFSVYEFLNRITLTSSNDQSSQEGKVNLMTIHASKGLEFHTVFLAGIEDHIIPHARSIEEDAHNIEEERRLFYVAITRAQRSLYMTSCSQRSYMREMITSIPSRFLEEIPKELIVHISEEEEDVSLEAGIDLFAQLRARISS